MKPALLLSSLALLALAGAARAEAPVSTTGAVQAPPTEPASEGSAAAQIDAFIHRAPAVKLDDGGPDGVVGEESPRRIHGEVGVGVGSGGYRSGYAMAVMPVGKSGTVAVAVSETRFGRRGGAGWGGGFGPGRFAAGGPQRQTLGVDLRLGETPLSHRACGRVLEPEGMEDLILDEPGACRTPPVGH